MATMPKDTTEVEYCTTKDLKTLLGIGTNEATKLLRTLNEEMQTLGYITYSRKVLKSYVLWRHGEGVDWASEQTQKKMLRLRKRLDGQAV